MPTQTSAEPKRSAAPPEAQISLAAAVWGGTAAPRTFVGGATKEANARGPGVNLEERVFDAQRLENLGLLAAGIAHDLNNVLAPITMIPSLLRQRIKDPLDDQMLDILEQSAARASDLVRQILGFARGAAGQRHVLQVKYILRDLVGLLAETFPKSIVIEESWDGDLWPVYGFPTQLHQTILNLCINARDAMPGGGTLRLRAQNRVLDELAAATLEGSRAGAWVVIAVEDSGTGMTPDVVARIWEPFFTTKDEGKGSGLGLPMVRNLIEGHGGFVILDTSVGRGSVFSVYLPAAPGSLEQASGVELPVSPRGEGQLVLVVDDESNVCDVTAATLQRHGYTVHATHDAIDALAWFACHQCEVSLVITDLKMPVCDGTTLAAVLRRMHPGTKIIAITGQVDDQRWEEPKRLAADRILLKPFNSDALLHLVHAVLAPSVVELNGEPKRASL